LYQIVHILEAAGIVERSVTPGEVTLVQRFYAPLDFNCCEVAQTQHPFSVEALLNRPKGPDEIVLERRWMEFVTDWSQSNLRRIPLPAQVMGVGRILTVSAV
jgi:hypothetical protein